MADNSGRKIGVLGAGWLGLPLVEKLVSDGLEVRASSRSVATLKRLAHMGAKAFRIDLPSPPPEAFFAELEALVVTLPPGGRQWKEAATGRYIAALSTLLPFIDARPELRLIYCSSTGVYGAARGEVDETEPLQPDTHSSRAVVAAEKLFSRYRDRLVVLRLAGLVGPGRHPGNFFGGKTFPLRASDAPVNLVHQADAIMVLRLSVNDLPPGVYNVCAAAHPPKGAFYGAAAGAMGLKIKAMEKGGEDGKRISSANIRRQGWVPQYDNLTVFLR